MRQEKIIVLVVEDDPLVREGLSLHLEGLNYDVHVADSSESGWPLFQKLSPNLSIIDILLGGEDGLTLIKQIRAFDEKAKIIAMSGGSCHLDGNYLARVACSLGASASLTKPFRTEQLTGAVEDILASA